MSVFLIPVICRSGDHCRQVTRFNWFPISHSHIFVLVCMCVNVTVVIRSHTLTHTHINILTNTYRQPQWLFDLSRYVFCFGQWDYSRCITVRGGHRRCGLTPFYVVVKMASSKSKYIIHYGHRPDYNDIIMLLLLDKYKNCRILRLSGRYNYLRIGYCLCLTPARLRAYSRTNFSIILRLQI